MIPFDYYSRSGASLPPSLPSFLSSFLPFFSLLSTWFSETVASFGLFGVPQDTPGIIRLSLESNLLTAIGDEVTLLTALQVLKLDRNKIQV